MTVKQCSGNILIVDDLPENLRVLSQMLENQGYKVRKAINGKTALRATQSTPPDLILLDIQMPEMNGYEVCEQIKKTATTQDIPIIFISALDEVFDKVKAFRVGGVDYITKPFQIEEVLARIETQLTIQKQKQQLQLEIEQRREAEEVLYQSRAILASVLNASRDGIAAMQAHRNNLTGDIEDFRCLVVNPVIAQLLGHRKEELTGKTVLKQFLSRIEPRLFEAFVAVVETADPLEQDFRYCHEGENHWYNITAVKLGDGFSVTIRDITQQKEIILSLQDQNEELAELSTIDGLTQVANRRYGDIYLYQQWQHLIEEGRSLALILCDVDCFKEYNDTYGHQAGDTCLTQIAQTIKNFLRRPEDLVSRYGGEEFLVILPNADVNWGMQVAELVRTSVLALEIPHSSSVADQFVTVSMGVAAMCPSQSLTMDALIEQADQALYNAKQSGRNCTIIAPGIQS
ncbi:diguanylate cyclase [Spirulina sp. CCNP1310]|uniref:diguanylate cyclase domain-containing protein n=1 Tax=Spirulina sp. CCNP1310 TaxID=3110249 RepID=UPI002B1FCF5A|nr:diguanylate cyclase [Spirulina sp. CCNP1310]MEA5419425.1 diguanylate cyclase [Spirulina sp. CCNP1310]